jgi:hypothetical protein
LPISKSGTGGNGPKIASFIFNFVNSQAPTCWSELPEKVWLEVFQNLSVEDVNNVHLVCRNLHQIANLHVNPKLRFIKNSPKDLEMLVQSSRIFEELKFDGGCTDYFASQEKFEILEEYLGFTGSHIKKLEIDFMKVIPLTFQKFLSLLPNLESLELDFVQSAGLKQVPIKWDLKPSKIERIRMLGCTGLEGLLGSLGKCAIQEVKLHVWPPSKSELLQKFLEAQKESLKKLVGRSCDFGFLANVKGLHLEHLEYSNRGSFIGFLEFLKRQVDLKFLSLDLLEYSDEAYDTIFGLKNLESLELKGSSDSSNLDNLHKLEKLRRLHVSRFVSRNILNHMQFGVFNDLEELDAHFEDASVESIREMKRITPNLKKLEIQSAPSSNTINAFLETLDILESVKIPDDWKMSGKVCPNIKHLHVETEDFTFHADQMTKQFPNLEDLKITGCSLEVKESLFIEFLSGLKQLKTLYMRIWCRSILDSETPLQWIKQHGKHLDDVSIIFVLPDPEFYPTYAIEKKPGDKFRISNKDEIDGTWIFGNFSLM